MSFLKTQFESIYSNPIPSHIPYSTALAALHDHGSVIDLSPLLSSKRRCNDGDDVGKWLRGEMEALKTREGSNGSLDFWEIHIPHPFGRFMGEIVYFSGFLDTPQGIQTITEVPGAFGLRIKAKYALEENGGEGLVFVETDEIECLWGLKTKVENDHGRAHVIMQERFVERLEESEARKQEEKS